MQCFTRLVRPKSVSPREMAFPHFRRMLRRTLLLRPEHSAPSTRARVQSSDQSTPAPTSDLTLCGLATTAQPMLGCPPQDGSCWILTFEPSVMVIFLACQSISLMHWSRKFVPRIPGTTKLSTTAKCIRPLQPPTCSGNTPWPQRRTLRPSPNSMEPLAASKGSPPVDFCQVESGTTETTAPLSKKRGTSSPFSLPTTDGVCPASSSVIARRRRS
ncbi:hypothetical protein T4A_10176 [Trichinella pseudospiralis]|uniref:Uncharacterized protein n=1 Tax=Trichinella pseudospiralis TaxID=6337 RepID=A0A0V1DVE2_TRIPS|nr:hypothetical protein T4A_10176 [Trichinella pseudospiralis]